MAKMKIGAMLLAFAVLLSGCSGFFDYNVFSQTGLTKPTVTASFAAVSSQSTTEQKATLDTLSANLSSTTYVAELVNNPDALAATEIYLKDLYSQVPTAENETVVQEAAVVYANLELDMTGGTKLVANIVSSLFSASTKSFSLGSATDATTLIKTILPAEIDTANEFADLVEGLVNADAAYVALAATLTSTDKAEDLIADINMGDVSQKAFVAYAVSSIVSLWQGTGETAKEAAADLWAYIQDPTDPTVQPSGDFSSILNNAAAGYLRVQMLFTVAGLDLSSYLNG